MAQDRYEIAEQKVIGAEREAIQHSAASKPCDWFVACGKHDDLCYNCGNTKGLHDDEG